MKKILNIVLIALIAIAVVPMILWIAGVFGPFQQNPALFGGADIMLAIAAVFLVLAVVATIVFTLMNVGKSRKGSGVGVWIFGGLAVIGVLLYFLAAKSTTIIGADKTVFDNAFTLKITDVMLWLAYIALGLTVITVAWGIVRKAIK